MTALTGHTTAEIEHYYERVRAALHGLPDEAREELLEDLPAHLAEVSAELAAEVPAELAAEDISPVSLADRLGPPEVYAAELLVPAGLEPAAAETAQPANGPAARLAATARRIGELADRCDVAAARLVGYPRVTDLLRAIRPGWWVLRGWVLAQFLCGTHNRASWNGFVPSAGGNRLAGLLLTVVAIIASVWFGRQSQHFSRWARRLTAAASLLIAAWGALILADNVGGTAYAYQDPSYAGYSSPYDSVSDVYAYDQAGKPLTGVRLFDQNGNPINLGNGACQNGLIAPGTLTEQWTYPLCPSNPGPFQAGPGPVASPSDSGAASDGASGSSSAGAPSAATSAPTPKSGTAKSATPKATPSRTR